MVDKIIDWVLYQARMLKHRPRLWWHRAFIRRNEFHKSLDTDLNAMMDMTRKDQQLYMADLVRRRNIAHERDEGFW